MNCNFATLNVLEQQLFYFFPSINSFMWWPKGMLAAKMAFICLLLAMKKSCQRYVKSYKTNDEVDVIASNYRVKERKNIVMEMEIKVITMI